MKVHAPAAWVSALVLGVAAPRPCRAAADSATALVAVYMAGGSLEDKAIVRGSWKLDEGEHLPPGEPSPFGAASDDLRELVEGYRSLAPDERERVAVWVAFGGARKAGWRGIQYADGACLSADSDDEIFGNADCYAYRDAETNMASREALARFLTFLPAPRAGTGPRVLAIWGQGGAFRGAIHDTVQQEIPLLALGDIADAFAQTGPPFDIVGFDAGLMASLEVALALRPHAKLLVASADTVPRHGWDYKALLSSVAKRRGDPPLAIATDIVDRFLDGESTTLDPGTRRRTVISHQSTRAKTLSVLETAKIEPLLARLGELANTAGKAHGATAALLSAFGQAPAFGRHLRAREVHTVDLALAMQLVEARVPALAARAAAVAAEVDGVVVYARHDENHPGSRGLAVFAPTSAELWSDFSAQPGLFAPAWRTLLEAIDAGRAADASPPVLEGIDDGEARLADDVGIVDVRRLRGEETEAPGVLRVWHDEPIAPFDTARQVRVSPAAAWDGEGLWLCSGPCRADNRIPVPSAHVGATGRGGALYAALARVKETRRGDDGEEALVFLEIGEPGIVSDCWLVPVEEDTNSDLLFHRDQYTLARGLSVAFVAPHFDRATGDVAWDSGESLELREEPRWATAPLPGPKARLGQVLVATDSKGRRVASPMVPAR